MSVKQTLLKCDTDGCPAVLTTKPPMKATPSNLRLHARTRGWTHRPRKDFCTLCSSKRNQAKDKGHSC